MAAFSLVSGDNTGADSVGNITFSKIRIFFTGYLIKSVLLIYHSMLVTKPVNFFFFFAMAILSSSKVSRTQRVHLSSGNYKGSL